MRESECGGEKKLRDRPKSLLGRPLRNSINGGVVYFVFASTSGAMSLYPLPWILIISIEGSSLRCLRSLVM